jgi:2-oxoglutarate ferredoxin oxidoreductase subunit alpha
MKKKPIEGEQPAFMTGNEVVAWAALAADAQFMYGYPITPQNEIMHYWTRLAPKFDRGFLQTEDEISAGFSTIGGVLGGVRSFTATAGPGNVLMQEPFSLAEANRLPIVTVIQQRGGPSTATVVYSQQEVILTTHGGNGEGLRIVYSASSHQDLYDYTIKAFNTAWKYRFPTFVLGDGYQAKMREPLTMYDPASRGIKMVETEPYLGKPGIPGVERPPVHLRNTYSLEEELCDVVMEMAEAYEKVAPEIIEWEDYNCDDAKIVLVAHGIVSRAAKEAVDHFRSQGVKVGCFRPITLRPFPQQQLRKIADRVEKLVVVESAYGQLDKLVRQNLYGATVQIDSLLRPGVCIAPEQVIEKLQQIME